MQPTVTGTFGELGSAAARRTRALVSSKGDFDETSDANARQLFLEQVAKAS